jgi:nucleoside-diphosphate-sugar epimerase
METINEPLYDLIFLDVYDDDDIKDKEKCPKAINWVLEKAKELLGYQPTHTIGEGLKEAVDWYWENLK